MIIKASKAQECDARPNGFIRAGNDVAQSPNAGFKNKTKFIINTRLVVGFITSNGNEHFSILLLLKQLSCRMTQAIKDEALEQIELDIKFGFENEDELFDGIMDMFYTEEDFDEDWLRQTIAEKYEQHQKESLQWKHPTDFEKLAQCFDELIKEKIVCLHKAGYTRQDAEGDCMETIEKLDALGVKALGFCYYHSQDLARTVDANIRNLFLGFDSCTHDDKQALQVAHKIVAALQRHGFEVNWPGTVDQRMEVKNIDWKKIPDHQEWGAARVITMLTRPGNNKKPFWKLW